jgi:hypothetical protein
VREPTRPSIMRRRALITMGVCALVLVIWWAIRTPEPPPPPAVPFGPGDALRAQVLGVVDGTTIQVDIEGGHERIHYLGIEPLGPSATRLLRPTGIWSRANASGSSWTCRSGIVMVASWLTSMWVTSWSMPSSCVRAMRK